MYFSHSHHLDTFVFLSTIVLFLSFTALNKLSSKISKRHFEVYLPFKTRITQLYYTCPMLSPTGQNELLSM